MSRKARVFLSTKLLESLLKFPPDHEIKELRQITPTSFELVVEGPSLPEEMKDYPWPIVEAVFEDGEEFIRFEE